MVIASKTIAYEHGGTAFEAYAAWDSAFDSARPVVLIAGTFMGRTAFEEEKARLLAALGYVGVAVDYHGLGHWPAGIDEARGSMDSLNADRALLRDRMSSALAAAIRCGAQCDPQRVAAIGFCFGGKAVLDLARSGAELRGVVIFHGLYDRPDFPSGAFTASVLVLHGWNDPLDPPDTVVALAEELTAAGIDWQIHSHGHTVHGFTNPAREGMYNPAADRRSWKAMTDFLEEILA